MRKTIVTRTFNRLLGLAARFLPGATTLRPLLHRLRGVRIGNGVFIGDDVYLENEYPERIELRDGCQICVRAVLLAHTRGPGRILVKRDAFIGATSVITAAPDQTLTIGEGAVVAAASLIAQDVPDHALVGTDRVRVMARATVPLRLETPFEDFLAGLRPFK